MSARQSAEVTRALRLIKQGSTAYAAAKKVGIALSTIYRAQARHRAPATGENSGPKYNPPTEEAPDGTDA